MSARDDGSQKVQTIRRRVQVTDVGLASGVKIGTLPKGAFISKISWHKVTAFNSTTSDTLQLGTTAAGVDILAATTIHDTGFVNHTAAAGLGVSINASADTDVFAKWVSGGGTPNAGDVTLVIEFVANHDG